MDVRPGTVVKVSDGFAWVEVERSAGCGRCTERGGCGQSCERNVSTYMIPLDSAVLPGERVELEVSSGTALLAALLTYGVALFALIVGVALGVWFGDASDSAVAVGLIAGLALAGIWLRASAAMSLLPAIRIVSGRPHSRFS
ncbi:SoxR reducing system RseC family protein [Methyloversatilis thermotolerans]|uniref:SoxR reducing system RseC family protein n=1 Tax=Methyloversatilis thermotolerans TaxID=1346290 RepID=UPI0003655680|nr:SoxR reducing system RseC family protein [Methyloversatilis thermotolerans]